MYGLYKAVYYQGHFMLIVYALYKICLTSLIDKTLQIFFTHKEIYANNALDKSSKGVSKIIVKLKFKNVKEVF